MAEVYLMKDDERRRLREMLQMLNDDISQLTATKREIKKRLIRLRAQRARVRTWVLNTQND